MSDTPSDEAHDHYVEKYGPKPVCTLHERESTPGCKECYDGSGYLVLLNRRIVMRTDTRQQAETHGRQMVEAATSGETVIVTNGWGVPIRGWQALDEREWQRTVRKIVEVR